mmetsp:Transcript_11347/g.31326  ORF Transcript_11347/g.31326 Transcript_11347/m.31326 type:complete len:222 (-) Transcript_11347:735-1400(-)
MKPLWMSIILIRPGNPIRTTITTTTRTRWSLKCSCPVPTIHWRFERYGPMMFSTTEIHPKHWWVIWYRPCFKGVPNGSPAALPTSERAPKAPCVTFYTKTETTSWPYHWRKVMCTCYKEVGVIHSGSWAFPTLKRNGLARSRGWKPKVRSRLHTKSRAKASHFARLAPMPLLPITSCRRRLPTWTRIAAITFRAKKPRKTRMSLQRHQIFQSQKRQRPAFQ